MSAPRGWYLFCLVCYIILGAKTEPGAHRARNKYWLRGMLLAWNKFLLYPGPQVLYDVTPFHVSNIMASHSAPCFLVSGSPHASLQEDRLQHHDAPLGSLFPEPLCSPAPRANHIASPCLCPSD